MKTISKIKYVKSIKVTKLTEQQILDTCFDFILIREKVDKLHDNLICTKCYNIDLEKKNKRIHMCTKCKYIYKPTDIKTSKTAKVTKKWLITTIFFHNITNKVFDTFYIEITFDINTRTTILTMNNHVFREIYFHGNEKLYSYNFGLNRSWGYYRYDSKTIIKQTSPLLSYTVFYSEDINDKLSKQHNQFKNIDTFKYLNIYDTNLKYLNSYEIDSLKYMVEILQKYNSSYLLKNKSLLRNRKKIVDILNLRNRKVTQKQTIKLLELHSKEKRLKLDIYTDYLSEINIISEDVIFNLNYKEIHQNNIENMKRQKTENDLLLEQTKIENRKFKFDEQYKFDEDTKIREYNIIFPKSEYDLKEEGFNLKHCVGTYGFRISEGEIKVFFVRKEKDISLFTCSVSQYGVIEQFYGKNNSRNNKDYNSAKKVMQEYIEKYKKKSVNL